MIEVARKALQAIEEEGFRAVVVGSLSLRLRGFDVECGDVDFLCSGVPSTAEPLDCTDPEHYSGRVRIDGVKVDYVLASGGREAFLTRVPSLIDGLPVADVADVLGLKLFAGREKDEAFFKERWADLIRLFGSDPLWEGVFKAYRARVAMLDDVLSFLRGVR